MYNALAAIAVGLELDMSFESIASGLGKYTGVNRRFQLIGEKDGITVIDDYAHHPTEVRATLSAASDGWPDRRIVAVFQPHLYSRTRDCKEDFARAFFDADVLVVTEIFGAREDPIPGIEGKMLADLTAQYGHRNVHFVAELEDLADYLKGIVNPGDAVITLGVGSIWRYSRKFFEAL